MLVRPLVAGALAAGSFLLATPADAGCYGTYEIFRACVTLPEVQESSLSQCVYTGGDTCENVTLPFVSVTGDATASCRLGSWLPDGFSHDPCRRADELLGP